MIGILRYRRLPHPPFPKEHARGPVAWFARCTTQAQERISQQWRNEPSLAFPLFRKEKLRSPQPEIRLPRYYFVVVYNSSPAVRPSKTAGTNKPY
jgi:hypothetical protein